MDNLIQWFSGGQSRYMTLIHCMNHDMLWIAITVALDLTVAAGYVLIAMHWWRNARHLPAIPAKQALGSMRNIFIFCGICGYLFIPIKMFWPAWRLYDIVILFLVYFTWKYALSAKNLKVVYSELGRSSKLAADLERSREESKRKSILFNALSHDLRTPLNSLSLQASILDISIETHDTAALRAAASEIRANTTATADLLDRLLEYARLESSEEKNTTSRFPLASLIEQVTSGMHAVALAKRLTLRCLCPADLVIHTDRLKLERILSNLVNNALKFTNTGGVRVQAECIGACTQIHVIDTGVGIPVEDQGRIFEEFYQVHNHERDRSKGFGLGLAVARRLALQLGGDLTLQSAAGSGSQFSILLPGSPEPARSVSPAIQGSGVPVCE